MSEQPERFEKCASRAQMSDTELMQATEEAEESVKGFIRRHIEPSQQATPRPWRRDGYQIFGADGQFVGSTFNKQDDARLCLNNVVCLKKQIDRTV